MTNQRTVTCGFVFLVAILTIQMVARLSGEESENWLQFRGPGASGIADGRDLPEKWSATENVLWKVDLPGRGWSSPVVRENRIFATSVVNLGNSELAKKGLYFGGNRPEPPDAVHQWKVFCLDLGSGEILWERQVREAVPQTAIHLKNSYASETPVLDEKHLYVYFGNVGVYCFDFTGKQVWSKEIEPHKTRNGWGTAASPVLHGERLYIVNDNDEDSYLLALDKNTGEEVWRTPRDEKSNWSTPYVWQNARRTELVTSGSGKVRSYDIEGNLLWSLEGMSSITIATPYAHDGLLYVSSGYVLSRFQPLYAIGPGAEGDISLAEGATSNDWIVWSQSNAAPYNPSTLVYNDLLFVLYDRGFLAAYNAADGSAVYDRKRIPNGRSFTSSPWAYNGRVFCLNEDGVTFVFSADGESKLLHQNKLAEDDMCMATPAIAGDKLLIRTAARIYCLKQGG